MNPVRENPLHTRDDLIQAALQILTPVAGYASEGRAQFALGGTGAVYTDTIAQMEAYARPLWAIVPMLAGKCPQVEPLWALWREGLENGVDPVHPEYWGEIGHFDQRMVEMAVMGVGMCLVPERFLGDLSAKGRENLHRWLSQINRFEMPKNNWVFFRILVNSGFLLNDLPYDAERLEQDLALIDSHYDGDGWYFDYESQRDYYVPWAFHYYGLIYAKAMERYDTERCARFIERAERFAPRFAAWFSRDGEALPYGRSLTYRFAQGSFFAAAAFAGIGTLSCDWGQMKGLLLRNLRQWFSKPIFTGDGLLSIGYGYPNLNMAEGYNAPGSPYWAMKAFLVLALPEEHPFWTSEESQACPPSQLADTHARMLIVRDPDNAHVQAFTAGNHAPEHMHTDAKYEKFAYSTAFGFSVSKGVRTLEQGAFDSMLALSEDGKAYRVRFGCEAFSIEETKVLSVWKPYEDVTVETEIRPLGNEWHLRIHRITTPRPLKAAEGGYAIAREQGLTQPERIEEPAAALVIAPWGVSGIRALRGYDDASIVAPEPNTNLFHPRTLIPTLTADIPAGETELICAVLGAVENGKIKWEALPEEVSVNAGMGR